jgi:hypothetical protein
MNENSSGSSIQSYRFFTERLFQGDYTYQNDTQNLLFIKLDIYQLIKYLHLKFKSIDL